MTAAPLSTARTLVKVAFLIRLAAVAVALGGLIGAQLTAGTYLAILLLAGASYLGLAVPRATELMVDHPLLAMADILLVVGVVAIFGVESPLALAAVSTALLVGVLYPAHVSAVLAVVLVVAHAGKAELERTAGADYGFLLRLGMPAVLLFLVFVGQSVRRIQLDQERAQSALSQVLEATATERERTRLARELHDSLAKSLQGLALSASALPRWVDRDPERASAEARSLAAGANTAVAQARTLMTQLRSDEPARSLDEVVGELVGTWQADHRGSVDLALAQVGPVDTDVRFELLAALREALHNAAQHAPGAQVRVGLTREGSGAVRLEVRDDGPGFDPGAIPAREAAGHFGIRGMSERMVSVGGSAEVDSAPGAGTRVLLWAPPGRVTEQGAAGRPARIGGGTAVRTAS